MGRGFKNENLPEVLIEFLISIFQVVPPWTSIPTGVIGFWLIATIWCSAIQIPQLQLVGIIFGAGFAVICFIAGWKDHNEFARRAAQKKKLQKSSYKFTNCKDVPKASGPNLRNHERNRKMKTTICILAVSLTIAITAYAPIRSPYSSGSLLIDTVPIVPAPPPTIYYPKDPRRVLDGLVYTLSGVNEKTGWVQFEGTVLEVQPHGVRLAGWYTGYYGSGGESAEFFVTNFPYGVAEQEKITVDSDKRQFFIAHTAGTHSYHTVLGGSRTIRMLDYGQIYVPTPEEIAAEQRAAQEKKDAEKAKADEGKARALRMNQDAAEKGDAYGLLRMGERYRDGEGVKKDTAKAKEYLQRAAAAGIPTAADELKKLQ